jgi:cytochrome c oxidase subunit IV
MEQIEVRRHIIPYRIFIGVWLLLILLTAILVLASKMYHQALSVWAMLIITPIKAGLVFFFFMHLKYERPFLKALVFLTLALLIMVIGLLFSDLSFR